MPPFYFIIPPALLGFHQSSIEILLSNLYLVDPEKQFNY